MSNDPDDLAASYQASLAHFVETGQEHQLEEAYSLGRAAFAGEVSILHLLEMHRTATESLLALPSGSPEIAKVTASFAFLTEALATFEMAQRGYMEAQERARLERDQSMLRERLTQAYLTVDRAVDLPERLSAIGTVAAELVEARGARCYLVDQAVSPTEVLPNHLIFTIRDPLGKTVAVLDVDVGNRGTVSDNDRFALNEFCRMAGVTVENARLFARERSTALMLQHQLLPATVPQVDGLDLAVRYLPGEANSHAGGDWYDVFPLDGERVGLVVGDVTGHGVMAAAAMGQLRIAVLAYALAGDEPAAVVERVDALLDRLGNSEIATMVYIVANPADGQLTLVNAGHPPPLVIDPEGSAWPVRGGHGRLLGISDTNGARSPEVTRLRPGGYLLLYTDGLIEPLERSEQDGIARLCEVAEGFAGTAEELCDRVLGELAPHGARDDICVLAATLSP